MRWHGHELYLLTWARCDLPTEIVKDACKQSWIKWWKVTKEQHKDGAPHYHAVIQTTFTCRVRGKAMDIGTFHPNIRKVQKSVVDYELACAYVGKEDTRIDGPWQSSPGTATLYIEPHEMIMAVGKTEGCERRFRDIERMNRLVKFHGTKTHIWPIKLIECSVNYTEKQRHRWYWGPSNIGKTTWMKDNLPHAETFCVRTKGSGMFDAYQGQSIILFDDVEEHVDQIDSSLASLCNDLWENWGPLDIHTRYENRMRPKHLLVVILSNYPPPEPLLRRESFLARFVVKRLTDRLY